MDMLTVLGRQFHAAQQLVRIRASRNPNEMIEEQSTFGERIADPVAGFGGSWTFIITFVVVLLVYTSDQRLPRGKRRGIRIRSSCSICSSPCWPRIQAPVIMMSQNRQDTKDRLRGELDYDVNRRAHGEIQGLAHKLNAMADQLGDMEDILREKSS